MSLKLFAISQCQLRMNDFFSALMSETVRGRMSFDVFKRSIRVQKEIIRSQLGRSWENPFTIIELAITEQSKEIIDFLIDEGFDVNQKDYYELGALDWAVENDDYEILEYLVEKGADTRLFKRGFMRPTNRKATHVISRVNRRVKSCRKSLLLFIWWCRTTHRIHPNVGINIIAKQMLWPTRLSLVW